MSRKTEVSKGIEWLKEQINDINPFTQHTWTWKKKILELIEQLDGPEALSDDWLDDQPMNITQHRTIALELTDLYARKNQDYGNSFDESLDEDGLLVLKIRLGDKYKRFSTLINQKNEVVDESMRDTLIDLANYALMGVMWMDNQEED